MQLDSCDYIIGKSLDQTILHLKFLTDDGWIFTGGV